MGPGAHFLFCKAKLSPQAHLEARRAHFVSAVVLSESVVLCMCLWRVPWGVECVWMTCTMRSVTPVLLEKAAFGGNACL